MSAVHSSWKRNNCSSTVPLSTHVITIKAYGVACERVCDAHEWNEERALRDEQLGGVWLVPLDEIKVTLEPRGARALAIHAAAAVSGGCYPEAAETERCEDCSKKTIRKVYLQSVPDMKILKQGGIVLFFDRKNYKNFKNLCSKKG